MRTEIKFGFLFIVLSFTTSPLVASTTDHIKCAREFIAMLRRGEYAKAVSEFDSTTKGAMPEQKLTATWEYIVDKFGQFEKEFSDTAIQSNDYDIIILTCKFERAALDVKVAFDKEGKIGGVFFAPSNIAEAPRPQEPKPPYPYRSEDVSFESRTTGMKYAGTLTLPDSGGPFPAVILITGSGVHDRNEAIFGHKPFLVIADYLTKKGIAVLRVDDRGAGASTGNKMAVTSAEHAEDVIAEIEFLKSQSEIDSSEIGVLGHSEGGVVAPMVAAKSPNVAFIVLMAGTGVPGYQVILDQLALLERAAGANDSLVDAALKLEKRVLNIVRTEKDSAKAADNLRRILETESGVPTAVANAEINRALSPSYRSLLSYDPRPTLEKVRCPVLAIWGSKDLQVPPAKNLPAVENALKSGDNKNFKVVEIPSLNHLFQYAKTGNPSEYAQIEETFSPTALEVI